MDGRKTVEYTIRQFVILLTVADRQVQTARAAMQAVLFAAACSVHETGKQITLQGLNDFVSNCVSAKKGYLYNKISHVPADYRILVQISLSMFSEDEYQASLEKLAEYLSYRLSQETSRYMDYIINELNNNLLWQAN